jgi:hypothetical protein
VYKEEEYIWECEKLQWFNVIWSSHYAANLRVKFHHMEISKKLQRVAQDQEILWSVRGMPENCVI